MWYRDGFVDWASEVLGLKNLPNLSRHDPDTRSAGVPIPICDEDEGGGVFKASFGIEVEDPGSSRFRKWLWNPRWGAFLHANAPRVAQKEEEMGDDDAGRSER
jgi:hypothetical protein